MKPVLVLGLGNRLMMDDGVGVAVVEALARLEPPDRRIRYEVGETDFAYSLELALEANCLIVVDAVLRQGNPGDVSILPLPEVSSQPRASRSTRLTFWICCSRSPLARQGY